MQAVRVELQKMVNGGASLHSDAVIEKSREFDELVMKHYQRKRSQARKVEKKIRGLRGKA